MSNADGNSLRGYLAEAPTSSRVLVGGREPWNWNALASSSFIQDQFDSISNLSIVIATIDQLAAIEALVQADGVARRIVLFPHDVSRDHLRVVADIAEADVIITDDPSLKQTDPRVNCIDFCRPARDSFKPIEKNLVETEWVLLTSGTSGVPKLVSHTLNSLCGAIPPRRGSSVSWCTFYDMRRYGGLQIFLRAALGGTSLVLRGVTETISDFLSRSGSNTITHILGTPSHWRQALMSPAANAITPVYVRLSGEIADQAVLNQLRALYPTAQITHAFASTEAGVVFEVTDSLMGFPSEVLNAKNDVTIKVDDGTIRVRSPRTASCYLGRKAPTLKDDEGFVDTGDVVELRDGRYFFAGRRDGVINVGGLKVHPEEIEAVINRHPAVNLSLVRSRKSPITGALVVADVVLKSEVDPTQNQSLGLKQAILDLCRLGLPSYKVPAMINFVRDLPVAQTGKLSRRSDTGSSQSTNAPDAKILEGRS